MKELFNVRTFREDLPYVECGKDTYYVRSNYRPFEYHGSVGTEYDEKQYSIAEFLTLLNEKNVLSEEYAVDVDYRLTKMEMGL